MKSTLFGAIASALEGHVRSQRAHDVAADIMASIARIERDALLEGYDVARASAVPDDPAPPVKRRATVGRLAPPPDLTSAQHWTTRLRDAVPGARSGLAAAARALASQPLARSRAFYDALENPRTARAFVECIAYIDGDCCATTLAAAVAFGATSAPARALLRASRIVGQAQCVSLAYALASCAWTLVDAPDDEATREFLAWLVDSTVVIGVDRQRLTRLYDVVARFNQQGVAVRRALVLLLTEDRVRDDDAGNALDIVWALTDESSDDAALLDDEYDYNEALPPESMLDAYDAWRRWSTLDTECFERHRTTIDDHRGHRREFWAREVRAAVVVWHTHATLARSSPADPARIARVAAILGTTTAYVDERLAFGRLLAHSHATFDAHQRKEMTGATTRLYRAMTPALVDAVAPALDAYFCARRAANGRPPCVARSTFACLAAVAS